MAVYLKNKDLLEELAFCKRQDKLTNRAIEMFQLLATNLSCKMQYKDEEDRKDCIAGAVMDCYLYWRGFNVDKSSNAFAYFSQVVKNGYAKQWRKLHPLPTSNFVSVSRDIWSL